MAKSRDSALITIECPSCNRRIYVCSVCGMIMGSVSGENHGWGECVEIPNHVINEMKQKPKGSAKSMVHDYRTFTAWALGAMTALALWALSDSLSTRVWGIALVIFIAVLFAAFWRLLGQACGEIIEFLVGAMAERRKRIEERRIEEILADRRNSE